jgi:hypothetical protein
VSRSLPACRRSSPHDDKEGHRAVTSHRRSEGRSQCRYVGGSGRRGAGAGDHEPRREQPGHRGIRQWLNRRRSVVLNRSQARRRRCSPRPTGSLRWAERSSSSRARTRPTRRMTPIPSGRRPTETGRRPSSSVNGAKTAGWSQRGTQPRMPRAARGMKQGIVAVVGFGFPARFAEMGTVRTPAQAVLCPGSRSGEAATSPDIVGEISRPKIGGPRLSGEYRRPVFHARAR